MTLRGTAAVWVFGFFLAWGIAPQHGVAEEPQPKGKPVDYLTQIKPLLKERCYACHGALKQESNLRLDTGKFVLRGGDSGPALIQGDAASSLIVMRVSDSDPASRMPPEFEGEALSPQQIALLRDWIAAGAPVPEDEQPEADPRNHWAFQPIVRPAVPQVSANERVKNPIDAFVARQHEQLGLRPRAEAPRLLLLRRLSLDLIGLPPTLEEIAAIEQDDSDGWYERTVTRLLADPRHGERWARHWMDIWRYSDWWGLGAQLRNSQQHIWHWRDWIVESLNSDLPYDEMVRLMLAADELHPNDLDKLRATGYLARNYYLFNRHQWMDETVEHVAKGFLGLTMNCAKCHDHKYDPISHVDYYQMRAFFEPYHVRMDMVPGEADLNRDGIPRAFDGALDTPTYRFIRGSEADPDKSVAIAPGVPELLEFAPLDIQRVELPPEAWQPERRPWVVEAHLAAARNRIETAQAKIPAAKAKLAAAERAEANLLAKTKMKDDTQPAAAAAASPPDKAGEIVERFSPLDSDLWKLCGGNWSVEAGKLSQRQDGATRAALRLQSVVPRDFEATIRFTIVGGSKWRSVGIGFDASLADPTATPGPGDSEQQVYASAYAGGPKVQGSYFSDGKWHYPSGAAVGRPIELNREHTLSMRVRDTLVNASLDGEPAIAWRTPLARRDGSLQITTFDALVDFHEVKIVPLAADVALDEPAAASPDQNTPAGAAQVVAVARQELQIAELALAVAQAEERSIERRAAALQARWKQSDSGDTQAKPDVAEAARQAALTAGDAERAHKAAGARLALAEAELRLLRVPKDKREAVEKEVAKAREAVDKAVKEGQQPSEQFSSLQGAKWSATRFLSSGKDDPDVPFPAHSSGRRTALARWITDPRNPLTARVAVNHLWSRHFGTPLVATVFDFGRNGAQPDNPELLDWLAAELIDSGWSMKHLHRLIVESAVYRQSSDAAGMESNLALDRDNRHLWRRMPTRIESQVVRDAILALAGTLDLTRGGPSVPTAEQAASTRRSLYFFHSNNERNLFLTMFDEALVKDCYRREQSIVPQQALALANSSLVLDAAPRIAERLSAAFEADASEDSANSDRAFIKLAFALLLGAEPDSPELQASATALEAWKKLPDAPQGEAAVAFARRQLVWVLLNHNDFVTLR